MRKYEVILDAKAREDLDRHIKAGNKILVRKIYKLIEDLENHPEVGIGKPEQLRYENVGIWSRRIDSRHRMLYTIEDDRVIVFVISLWGHYE